MITDDYGNQVPASKVREIVERLDAGDMRMAAIEADLAKNTEATKEVAGGVHEILEIFGAMKGGLKVLEGMGKLLKPVTAIIAFLLALWSAYIAFRNGHVGPR